MKTKKGSSFPHPWAVPCSPVLACICHSLSLWMACLHRWPISSRARWIALRPARTTSSSPPLCPLTSALPAPSPTASTEAAAWARGWGVDLLSLPPSQGPLLPAAWGLFLEMPFVSHPSPDRIPSPVWCSAWLLGDLVSSPPSMCSVVLWSAVGCIHPSLSSHSVYVTLLSSSSSAVMTESELKFPHPAHRTPSRPPTTNPTHPQKGQWFSSWKWASHSLSFPVFLPSCFIPGSFALPGSFIFLFSLISSSGLGSLSCVFPPSHPTESCPAPNTIQATPTFILLQM